MKKIVTIVGARPQFIKAAAVSREIAHHQDIREIIVHTGQHFDANMSDVFFEEMHIPKPDYNLDVNGLGHGAMTGQMMEKIEQVLLEEKPDWVLVYGDTNSTIAGALAARKLHIKWLMWRQACDHSICECRRRLTVFSPTALVISCFAPPTKQLAICRKRGMIIWILRW
jgi:hypothetical protein